MWLVHGMAASREELHINICPSSTSQSFLHPSRVDLYSQSSLAAAQFWFSLCFRF